MAVSLKMNWFTTFGSTADHELRMHTCMFVFKAMVGEECVGAIVCKLDMHKKMFRRGYIAMLAVDSKYRRKGIGKNSLFCYFSLKSCSWDNCSCHKDLSRTELLDVVLCLSSLPYSTTQAPQWLFFILFK